MSRELSKSRLFLLVVLTAVISTTSATRCYRCNEGGLKRDVRNCGKTIECRYGCKITQVLSVDEVVVEQDCFEMSFPYTGNRDDNVNPTYIPQSQYPSRQLPPGVFSPHNPDNRDYNNGWDNTNINNHNNNGLNGCSTLSAIQRFRSLFPYASGYSATCNNCDWDYCNAYNGGNGVQISVTAPILVSFVVFLKSFW